MFRAAAAAALRKRQHQKTKLDAANRKGVGRRSPVVGYHEEDRYRRGSYDSEYDSDQGSVSFNLEDDFRIKIGEVLRRKEKGVHFKDDKDRFPQQYTLKLRKEGKYKISVEVNEGVEVSFVKLGGIHWDEFEVEQTAEKVEYSFIWNTDKVGLVGDHYRAVFPCVVKLKDDEEIKFDAMLKFYKHIGNKNKKERYTSGPQLQYLSLEPSTGVHGENIYKLMYNEVVRAV